MSKRGRPLVDDAKRHQYTLHMSDDEYEMLNKIVKSTGKKRSEVLREGIEEIYYKNPGLYNLAENHKV